MAAILMVGIESMRRLGPRTKRETSRLALLLLGPQGIVGVFLLGASAMNACGGTQAESAPDAGLDVADDSTQVGACTLSGDRCVGQAVCCPPFPGRIVDHDAGCKARAETQVACRTPGSCQGMTMAGLVGCYRRSNDDGSTTTFYASHLYPRTPSNVVRCDQDETSRVTAYPDCP